MLSLATEAMLTDQEKLSNCRGGLALSRGKISASHGYNSLHHDPVPSCHIRLEEA